MIYLKPWIVSESKSNIKIEGNVALRQQFPSMSELSLSRWLGLSTKKFQPECVNEESSTERRS